MVSVKESKSSIVVLWLQLLISGALRYCQSIDMMIYFNLDIPNGSGWSVPSEILDPKNTWIDKDSYDLSAKKLAQMFVENFAEI